MTTEVSLAADSVISEDSSDVEINVIESNGDNHDTLSIQSGDLLSTKCPICLDVPDIFAVAECGHAFCHECIHSSLTSGRFSNSKKGQCPLCRKSVKYSNTLYLELKVGKRATPEDIKKPENLRENHTNDKKAKGEKTDANEDPALFGLAEEPPEEIESTVVSKTITPSAKGKRSFETSSSSAAKRSRAGS